MLFYDTESGATLTLFISGYEHYESSSCYADSWLDMSFTYANERDRQFVSMLDSCVEPHNLHNFAQLFLTAPKEIPIGGQDCYFPMEQIPFIELTRTEEDLWTVFVEVLLPNGGPNSQYYRLTDTHVTTEQILQHGHEFCLAAFEWPGRGLHCTWGPERNPDGTPSNLLSFTQMSPLESSLPGMEHFPFVEPAAPDYSAIAPADEDKDAGESVENTAPTQP